MRFQRNLRRVVGFVFVFFPFLTACLTRPEMSQESETSASGHPNIVYILADDLGYGDVSHLNEASKISTPNLDRIATEGMVFTDAHSGSAVCTPTRYGILTGRYAWRSRLKESVLWGYSPPVIESGRLTVASLLKQHGYRTAVIGKWHLGLGWHTTDGTVPNDRRDETGKTIDFSQPVRGGPSEVGFDYFFGIPASLDMEPYVYLENDRVVELPTSRIDEHEPGGEAFWREGPIAPGFKHVEVLPMITEKAIGFLERHVEERPEQPFFLYFALTAPHAPVLPNQPFQGKSQAGRYGDFVFEVDYRVGQILAALDHLNLSDDTLVVFTSDNGPERFMVRRIDGFGHNSSYHFRGMKRDLWEGGHRVPFFARWPGRIRPGTTSSQTICLTDLMATVADILGVSLPEAAGEDSYSVLPALLGKEEELLIREATVHHSSGGKFAIRQGDWKLCQDPGSGGNHYASGPNAVGPNDPPVQLYNLAQDVREQENVAEEHPEIIERLTALLEGYRNSDRSIRR